MVDEIAATGAEEVERGVEAGHLDDVIAEIAIDDVDERFSGFLVHENLDDFRSAAGSQIAQGDGAGLLQLPDRKVTRYGPADLASCMPYFSVNGAKLAIV